jgi:alpha-L-fucosidase
MQTPVTTDQVRIRITASRLEPTLAEVGLFKRAEMIQPPVIAERDATGAVSISDAKGLTIVYTTDGTVPTAKSAAYRLPIDLASGGTVNAACVGKDGRVGMVVSKYVSGYAPIGWKVAAVDGQAVGQADTATNAIDGKASTIWQAAEGALPHSLTVDMGHELKIGGFSYLPRQDRNAGGVVDTYKFETSNDGQKWTAAVEQGRFGNIRNNPVLQEVPFKEVSARYFRFTALREVNGNNAVSVAELTVLPAPKAANNP